MTRLSIRPGARGGAASDRTTLYDEITAKIIAELEEGRVPWVQPWGTSAVAAPMALPKNATTGRRGCYLLSPLFPLDMRSPVPDEEYKQLAGEHDRFDLVLLDQIAEFSTHTGVDFDRVVLTGFSGGGQFAHRFLYVHPDRVAAVSIGAPGWVTLPDPRHDWFAGLRDFEARFGKPFNARAVASVPTLIVAGELDMFPFLTYPAAELGMSEAEMAAYGDNRVSRARRLHAGLRALGSEARLKVLEGVGHKRALVLDEVQAFITETLGLSPIS